MLKGHDLRCCLDINGKKVTFVLICPTVAYFSDMEGNTYWGSSIFQIKWWDEMNGKTSLMWPWSGGTGTMDYCAGLHLSCNYILWTNLELMELMQPMWNRRIRRMRWHASCTVKAEIILGSSFRVWPWWLQMAFFMFRFIPLFSRNGPLGIRLLAQGRPV